MSDEKEFQRFAVQAEDAVFTVHVPDANKSAVKTWAEGKKYVGKLAKITSTSLGFEDHGMFVACIMLDGGGWGQGLQVCLKNDKMDSVGDFISALLKGLKVENWEDLKGLKVYGLYDYPYSHSNPIVGLMMAFDHHKIFLLSDVWPK